MLVIHHAGNNDDIGGTGGRRRRHISARAQQHNHQNVGEQQPSISSQESGGSMNADSTSGTGGSGSEGTYRLLFHASRHQVSLLRILRL